MRIWFFAFQADFYGYANVDEGKVCSVFKKKKKPRNSYCIKFPWVKNSYPGIWEEIVYTHRIHSFYTIQDNFSLEISLLSTR